MTLFLSLLAVAGLLLLNAFFVAAEYALVTARRTRITELRDQGNRRARVVLRITANPARFIAAMQLGVTITSLGERGVEAVFGVSLPRWEHALPRVLDEMLTPG